MSDMKLRQTQLPQGWEIKKLGEVCEIIGGGTPSKGNNKFYNGNILWATVRDMKGDTIGDTKHKITKEAVKNSSTNIIPKGNVIIATRVGLGKTCLIENETAINQDLKGIIPRKNSAVSVSYLFQWFKSISHLIVKEGTGATVQGVKLSFIKAYPIPLPPLPEQKRIVAILDKAFAAIAKAKANVEQNLKNAKELFESYLQGVFENKGEGWEEKTLGEVCEITSKLIDPKELKFQNSIHIGAGNIESRKGSLIDLKTAKEENLISGKFSFDETMVLYSKIRPYLMKIVKCNFKGLCSADIYPLTPLKNKITQEFLYHLLSSNHFTEYAIEGSQRAGMPKVNRKHLFCYVFYCPKISEQQTIVKKLDALSTETKKLEAIYQQKIGDMEELKKSVLQKAFNGELTKKGCQN